MQSDHAPYIVPYTSSAHTPGAKCTEYGDDGVSITGMTVSPSAVPSANATSGV